MDRPLAKLAQHQPLASATETRLGSDSIKTFNEQFMVPDRKGLALITQRPGPGVTGPAGWLSSISPQCEEGLLAPGPRFHSSPARYAAGELAARGAVAWLSRPSLSGLG